MTACVELRGAGKVYPSRRGEVVALRDVTISITDGEFISLLGPSGCGKSTLLKCVAGLEDLTSGELRVPLGAPWGLRLGAVAFLDGGDCTDLASQLDIDNLNWAVGGGLRSTGLKH